MKAWTPESHRWGGLGQKQVTIDTHLGWKGHTQRYVDYDRHLYSRTEGWKNFMVRWPEKPKIYKVQLTSKHRKSTLLGPAMDRVILDPQIPTSIWKKVKFYEELQPVSWFILLTVFTWTWHINETHTIPFHPIIVSKSLEVWSTTKFCFNLSLHCYRWQINIFNTFPF